MSCVADAADSRQRLIDAAMEIFREEGYRASVERIAAKAGVARQTLYNHFPSKDALFAEMASRCTATILVSLDGDEADVRECLLRFAAAFRAKLLGDDGLAGFRALIGEVKRFPALASAFYDNGPGRMAARLAEFIERAMTSGALRRDDPVFAAEMLLSMLTGIERTHRLCGAPALPPEREAGRIARVVDCFLAAFAPERKSA